MTSNLNPHVSVDCLIFGFNCEALQVLLVERKLTSRKQKTDLKLPGSLVYNDEDLTEAAHRVLKELTGLNNLYLEQFGVFGAPNRISDKMDLDWLSQTTKLPISRVVTIAYYSLVKLCPNETENQPKIKGAKWVNINDVRKLPFDHNHILEQGLQVLRSRMRTEPIGFELLPRRFTLRQLQTLYEVMYNKPLDNRNFRKKVGKLEYLVPLNAKQKNVAHKPARYYKFDKRCFFQTRKEAMSLII